jgi:hypothetical protein
MQHDIPRFHLIPATVRGFLPRDPKAMPFVDIALTAFLGVVQSARQKVHFPRPGGTVGSA